MSDGTVNVFGRFTADYILEDVNVDNFDITSAVALVQVPYPIDMKLMTKNWAPDLGIPCTGMKWRSGKGLQQFRFSYEGATDFTFAEAQTEYELDFAMQEVGLEAFSKWSTLKKKYGLQAIDGEITCPSTMPGDPKTPNPFYGVDSFEIVGLIWRKITVARTLPQSISRQIGLIDQPEGGDGNQPPVLPGPANWRLIEAPARWRGNIWRLARGWRASGPRGWIRDLYGSNPLAALS